MNKIDIYTAAHIMQFLDQKSKIMLSSTCKYFRQLLNFITEINITNVKRIQYLFSLKYKSIVQRPLFTTIEVFDAVNIEHIKYISLFKNLISLNCSGSLITTPEITCFNNLTSLNCSWCTHIINLTNLPNLTSLDCSYCQNIKNLGKLPNLIKLNCSYTNIVKLDNFTKLRKLNCCNCDYITDLSKLKKLTVLECYGTHIKNLDQLQSLTDLNCGNTTISNTEINKLTNLIHLNCSFCYKINNLDELKNLVSLECNFLTQPLNLDKLVNLSKLECCHTTIMNKDHLKQHVIIDDTEID